MKVLKVLGLCALGLTLVNCKEVKLDTDKSKYSYAIGQQIAQNIKKQNERQSMELDNKAFVAGISDTFLKGEGRMTEEEAREALKKMTEARREAEKKQGEENKAKGAKFLEENKKKEGVKVTESGLQYIVVSEGKGKKPKAKDTVKVHYKGMLIDGKEFDSSYKRNRPAEFPVNAVIPGWTEALQLMKVGSKYKLFIPSDLAYGERGNPTIPANSVLIFDVELLDIVKKKK